MKIERNNGIEGTATPVSSGIVTDGPKYNYFGFMRHMNGKLYTGGGQSSPEREACIQILDGNDWEIYDDSFAASLKGNYRSTYCIDTHCGFERPPHHQRADQRRPRLRAEQRRTAEDHGLRPWRRHV